MINNDVIRSIRYILNVSDQKLVEIVNLAGLAVPLTDIQDILTNDEDPNFLVCDDKLMAHFLDGLIFLQRGKDETKPPMPFEFPITNNVILKKLRVAFELKEDAIHEILNLAGCSLGRSELSAFMRKRDHSNYRECGDQVLRYFLKGLKMRFRGS
jgi:uncharacterized protein YehS (DUF1456 family)